MVESCVYCIPSMVFREVFYKRNGHFMVLFVFACCFPIIVIENKKSALLRTTHELCTFTVSNKSSSSRFLLFVHATLSKPATVL